MTETGRLGWSRVGMPDMGTGYYQYLLPTEIGTQVSLGPNYVATHLAVIAFQRRINGLGFKPALRPDGHFGVRTDLGTIWSQKILGLTVDGQIGPKTAALMFWKFMTEGLIPDRDIAKVVGGIAWHESKFDPGAVGFYTPQDHGLVQINTTANPTITIEQMHDPRFSLTYCAKRIRAGLIAFNDNLDIAICSYANPGWARDWARTGESPNTEMTLFVNQVKAWVPPGG